MLGISQAYFVVVVGSFSSKLQKLRSLIIGQNFQSNEVTFLSKINSFESIKVLKGKMPEW